MQRFLRSGLGRAVSAAEKADWHALKWAIEDSFEDEDVSGQASALTIVIALTTLRRGIGVGRTEILKRSADFMITVCGAPGETGWMGLRFCCPWCGYVPVGEQGWFVLNGAGRCRLIPVEKLTAEQRQRWARIENDPNHNEDVEEFFSTEKSSGWICAACGDEFPMTAQDAEVNPQMLLAVQKGPNKDTDMIFYKTQMPQGVAANVVRA